MCLSWCNTCLFKRQHTSKKKKKEKKDIIKNHPRIKRSSLNVFVGAATQSGWLTYTGNHNTDYEFRCRALLIFCILCFSVQRMTPSCCTLLCTLGTTVGLWAETWWGTTRPACQMEPPSGSSSSGREGTNWWWTGTSQRAGGSDFRWRMRPWEERVKAQRRKHHKINSVFVCVFSQSIPSYDTIVQTSGGNSWHIPYDETEDRSTYEVPQHWLCLNKKLWRLSFFYSLEYKKKCWYWRLLIKLWTCK